MKVVHLTDRWAIGGGAEYIRLLRRGLTAVESRTLYAAKGLCRAGIVNRLKPDVIHVTHLRALLQLFANPFSRPKAPVVFTVHGVHLRQFDHLPPTFTNRLKRWLRLALERRLYRKVDALIALTEADAQYLRENYGRLAPIFVVPNGLDFAGYRDECVRAAGTEYAYISIARFCFQKDQPTLIEAVARAQDTLRERGERVLLIGAGEGLAAARRRADALGIGDLVTFAGAVKHAAAELPRAKALVATSRWEGLPFLLLEAAAYRMPVIASDCPGHRELVRDGETGRLFPVGDASALAAIFERGIVEDDYRMAAACAAEKRRQFPLAKMLDGTLAVYRAVTAAETPRGGAGRRLARLFAELFQISLFVIGGGYSILMAAERRFAKLGWIRDGELLEVLPVFQTIPGLIATHTAVYLGRRRAGALGAAVAVAAVALPAMAIFTTVAVWYRDIPMDSPWIVSGGIGLRSALAGILAATIFRSWRKSLPDFFSYGLSLLCLLLLATRMTHVALVLFGAVALSVLNSPPAWTFCRRAAAEPPRKFRSVAALLPLLLFLEYGSLCFGGGFVIVPMYMADFVGTSAPYLQLGTADFANIMALSQMTPGPVGVNCASYFGYLIGGVGGSVAAAALLLLPGAVMSFFAFDAIAKYGEHPLTIAILRGIRPASIALMLVALWPFLHLSVFDAQGNFHAWGPALVTIAIALCVKTRLNVVILILLTAVFAALVKA